MFKYLSVILTIPLQTCRYLWKSRVLHTADLPRLVFVSIAGVIFSIHKFSTVNVQTPMYISLCKVFVWKNLRIVYMWTWDFAKAAVRYILFSYRYLHICKGYVCKTLYFLNINCELSLLQKCYFWVGGQCLKREISIDV